GGLLGGGIRHPEDNQRNSPTGSLHVERAERVAYRLSRRLGRSHEFVPPGWPPSGLAAGAVRVRRDAAKRLGVTRILLGKAHLGGAIRRRRGAATRQARSASVHKLLPRSPCGKSHFDSLS